MARVRLVLDGNAKQIVEQLPGVQEEITKRATRIAVTTVLLSLMASRHGGRYGEVVVRAAFRLGARTVAAMGSFAHLDEWGSANNPPHASMRRAAEREGRLVMEG